MISFYIPIQNDIEKLNDKLDTLEKENRTLGIKLQNNGDDIKDLRTSIDGKCIRQ